MSRKEKFSRKDLPDELHQQFTLVERRLWRVETAMAVCLAAAGLFGSYLVLFFSDPLWDSPSWLRLSLLAAGVGTSVASVVWWLSRWVFHKRDTRALAKLVQRLQHQFHYKRHQPYREAPGNVVYGSHPLKRLALGTNLRLLGQLAEA